VHDVEAQDIEEFPADSAEVAGEDVLPNVLAFEHA